MPSVRSLELCIGFKRISRIVHESLYFNHAMVNLIWLGNLFWVLNHFNLYSHLAQKNIGGCNSCELYTAQEYWADNLTSTSPIKGVELHNEKYIQQCRKNLYEWAAYTSGNIEASTFNGNVERTYMNRRLMRWATSKRPHLTTVLWVLSLAPDL